MGAVQVINTIHDHDHMTDQIPACPLLGLLSPKAGDKADGWYMWDDVMDVQPLPVKHREPVCRQGGGRSIWERGLIPDLSNMSSKFDPMYVQARQSSRWRGVPCGSGASPKGMRPCCWPSVLASLQPPALPSRRLCASRAPPPPWPSCKSAFLGARFGPVRCMGAGWHAPALGLWTMLSVASGSARVLHACVQGADVRALCTFQLGVLPSLVALQR